jgi:hypothetical protein
MEKKNLVGADFGGTSLCGCRTFEKNPVSAQLFVLAMVTCPTISDYVKLFLYMPI